MTHPVPILLGEPPMHPELTLEHLAARYGLDVEAIREATISFAAAEPDSFGNFLSEQRYADPVVLPLKRRICGTCGGSVQR